MSSSTNPNSFLASFGRRKKTISECSDSSSVDGGESKPASAGLAATTDDGNYLYDLDGKYAYSYYEKKPELYDIDGKHRYKYYSHLKSLPSTHASPSGVSTNKSLAIGKPSYKAVVTGNYLYDIDGKFSYEVFGGAGKTKTNLEVQRSTEKLS